MLIDESARKNGCYKKKTMSSRNKMFFTTLRTKEDDPLEMIQPWYKRTSYSSLNRKCVEFKKTGACSLSSDDFRKRATMPRWVIFWNVALPCLEMLYENARSPFRNLLRCVEKHSCCNLWCHFQEFDNCLRNRLLNIADNNRKDNSNAPVCDKDNIRSYGFQNICSSYILLSNPKSKP